VLGGLTAAACTGRRYLPLALGMGVVVLSRSLSRAKLEREPHRLASRTLLAGCAAFVAATGCSTEKDPWRDAPVLEAKLVEQLSLPARVANLYQFGGYLDYAWNGRIRVLVDGRNQLFEQGAFADSADLKAVQGWREILDRRGINTVLWESRSPLDAALAVSPDWLLVRRGRIAVVYSRQHPLPIPSPRH